MKWLIPSWPEFWFFLSIVIVNDAMLDMTGAAWWWPETAIAYIAGAFAARQWKDAFPESNGNTRNGG